MTMTMRIRLYSQLSTGSRIFLAQKSMNSNQTRTLCHVGSHGPSGHNVILAQIMKIIDHVSDQILARRIVYQTFKKNLAHQGAT